MYLLHVLVYAAMIEHILFGSLSVPGADENLQVTYGDLLPDKPRIIDPINPANNLYLSGITRCKREENKWGPFMRKIDSLNLSPDILRQHKRVFHPD